MVKRNILSRILLQAALFSMPNWVLGLDVSFDGGKDTNSAAVKQLQNATNQVAENIESHQLAHVRENAEAAWLAAALIADAPAATPEVKKEQNSKLKTTESILNEDPENKILLDLKFNLSTKSKGNVIPQGPPMVFKRYAYRRLEDGTGYVYLEFSYGGNFRLGIRRVKDSNDHVAFALLFFDMAGHTVTQFLKTVPSFEELTTKAYEIGTKDTSLTITPEK